MPTLKIDGQEVTVPPGTSVFNACRQSGAWVPNYCYHPGLSVAGNCRVCQVEIKGQPKPAISCNTPCADGMEVFTKSEKALKARKGVMEFLLINHPLDCPTCDQAGECELQDYAAKENQLQSRFGEEKILKPRENFGPHIQYVPNRCILCTRCVRFGIEISGNPALGVVQRGAHAEIALFPGSVPEDELFSNVADVCPVGALLTRDTLHEGRAWFLKRTPSTCPSCSRGCAVYVDAFRDKVTRLRPHHNPEVNGWWICDAGRYHHRFVNREDRLRRPLVRGNPATWEHALKVLRDGVAGGAEAVGSAWSTTEELALLAKAARPAAFLTAPDGNAKAFPKGFVIDADKNPNRRGARKTLGVDEAASRAFWERAAAGQVKAVLLLNGIPDYAPTEIERAGWARIPFRAVLGLFPEPFAREADAALPIASYGETSGTFTNSQGHVQWARQAVKPSGETREAWRVLAALAGVSAAGPEDLHRLLDMAAA